MENEKNPGMNDDSKWLEELLSGSLSGETIDADENAVAAHGMSDISDMELDKIIQEAIEAEWGTVEEPEPVYMPPEVQTVSSEEEYSAEEEEASYDQEVAPEEQEEEETPEESGSIPRKVRPKRTKGYGLFGLPHLASVIIWMALAIFIGTSLGRLVWVCASDLLAFGRENRSVSITITETDTLDTITSKLYNAGLIKYPTLFKMYCQLAKVEEKDKISVGTFELNTLYDYHALVGGMSATSSYRETVEVMIPEGYTCAQIFALLEEKGVCSVEDLEEYASTSEFADYWFLNGVPRGTKYCLEGFLFPDTYEFYTDSSAKQVFIKFLNRFSTQFSEEMQDQLIVLNQTYSKMLKKNGYPQSYIDEHQLTLLDLVTIASMIEKESAHSGESVDISSVIYNRLSHPNYPYLNIDATLVYALDGKTDLTEEDKKVDSPYNTYKYEGLPPGPISNPGLLSLKAALNPSDSSYYFYALDPTAESREHRFFATYQEHLDFLNKNR